MPDSGASAATNRRAISVGNGEYDVVVLDEILGSVTAGLVPLGDPLEMVRSTPRELRVAALALTLVLLAW